MKALFPSQDDHIPENTLAGYKCVYCTYSIFVCYLCDHDCDLRHIPCPCRRPQHFARDFCVPQAPASLLKAVLICAGIVILPPALLNKASRSKESPEIAVTLTLEQQLQRVFGRGGIRITSRSLLPQGSGMGTSSILAGEDKPRSHHTLLI